MINCLHHVVTLSDKLINSIEIAGVTLEQAVGEWFAGKKAIYIDDGCTGIGCNANCPTSEMLER